MTRVLVTGANGHIGSHTVHSLLRRRAVGLLRKPVGTRTPSDWNEDAKNPYFIVGEVHALAVERGEPGIRYIVGGENEHLTEVSALISKFAGVKTGHLGLPRPVAVLASTMIGFSSRFTGSKAVYERKSTQDSVARYGYYDCSLTRQTFGISPCLTEETIKDTIRWLLFLGKINPETARQISPAFPPDPAWGEFKEPFS